MMEFLSFVKPFLADFASAHQTAAQIFFIIGALRVCVKPVMTMVSSWFEMERNEVGNQKLNAFMASKFYTTLVFVLDYFASIKLPTVGKPRV